MDKIKCKTCDQKHICQDSITSWVVFLVGVIATISVRLVAIFMTINPLFAKILWYIGIILFLIFFMYRYKISKERYNHIKNRELIHKLNNEQGLDDVDQKILSNLLCSLSSKKESINFAVIFIFSAIALFIVILIDTMKFFTN